MALNNSTPAPVTGLFNRGFATSLLLALAWLLLVRASFILQSGIWPNLPVALLSDLVGAFLLATLLQLSSGLWRVIFIALLGFGCFVAGMHLTVHGTLFRLSLIGKGLEPTFVTGSLINVHSLLMPAYMVFAWLLHRAHRALVPVSTTGHRGVAASAIILLAGYMLVFQSLSTPSNNVVASSLGQLPVALLSPLGAVISESQLEPDGEVDNTRFFHQRAAAPAVASPPNVLLIMIEGLSGGYFPQIGAYHSLEPAVSLTQLEQRLSELGFRNFRNALSMERQTERGTFAILCGAYPDLRRQPTKVTDVAGKRANADCLPERLRDAGYHTAYWQAAPIEYMAKHTFMPRIGFDDVTGAEAFAEAGETVEGWGPSDPAYLQNISQRLRQLDASQEPWLVTLLNVGTHHPFNTGDVTAPEPAETATPDTQEARRQAMLVMEQALVGFLDELEASGALDDTLVIITSDESGGFVRRDHETIPLNNNMGALAIRPPKATSLDQYAGRDQIVAQIDIPLTILDAAGLGDQRGDMIGRSLQAESDRTRDLILADTYSGIKYFLRESGRLMACSELTTQCTSWRFDPARVFGSLVPADDAPFLTLRERLTLIEKANYIEPAQ